MAILIILTVSLFKEKECGAKKRMVTLSLAQSDPNSLMDVDMDRVYS